MRARRTTPMLSETEFVTLSLIVTIDLAREARA
jgi:hypothetical protein